MSTLGGKRTLVCVESAGMTARLSAQIISIFVIATPVQAAEGRFDPRTIMVGSVTQIARSARDAINCGFEVVTVRPWHDGDMGKPSGRIPNPMVLIVQPPANEARMQSAYSCFDRKSGVGDKVIA